LGLVSIAMLPVNDAAALLCVLASVLMLYASLGREACRQLALLRPLIPILAVLFAIHLWGTGWEAAIVSVSRLLAMVMLANAVTMTTTMSEMMDAVDPLFSPLRALGVETRKVALAVALVVRFIPVLFAEWASRKNSWNARGGGRHTWRLLPAFCLGVLRLSTHVGNALDARGFTRCCHHD
jgi:biotin transport system permease protein